MFKSILFAALFTTCAYAKIPLPREILDIQRIVEEFRRPLQDKVDEMGKNYIVDTEKGIIVYKAQQDTQCIGLNFSQYDQISKIIYTQRQKENQIIEVFNYYGCDKNREFQETLVREGIDLIPMALKDYAKGKMRFNLNSNETSLSYKITNPKGKVLFRLQSRKIKNTISHQLSTLDQKFLIINDFEDQTHRQVRYDMRPVKINFSERYTSFRSNYTFDPDNIRLSIHRDPVRRVSYYNKQNLLLSQDQFLNILNKRWFKTVLGDTKRMISYHIFAFPKTVASSSGAQDTKLLNELRLARIRLLSGTSLDQVRITVDKIIKAISSGEIKVSGDLK